MPGLNPQSLYRWASSIKWRRSKFNPIWEHFWYRNVSRKNQYSWARKWKESSRPQMYQTKLLGGSRYFAARCAASMYFFLLKSSLIPISKHTMEIRLQFCSHCKERNKRVLANRANKQASLTNPPLQQRLPIKAWVKFPFVASGTKRYSKIVRAKRDKIKQTHKLKIREVRHAIQKWRKAITKNSLTQSLLQRKQA